MSRKFQGGRGVSEQPDGVEEQRRLRDIGRGLGEVAVLKEEHHQRLREDHQAHGGGDRQEEDKPQARLQRSAQLPAIVRCLLGHRGEDRG